MSIKQPRPNRSSQRETRIRPLEQLPEPPPPVAREHFELIVDPTPLRAQTEPAPRPSAP